MNANKLIFTKYHGNGNDFIIVDLMREENSRHASDLSDCAKNLCDRFRGIGGDGMITVIHDEHGARMRVYNADGSEAKNCGNGLRCVASYLFNKLDVHEITIVLGDHSYRCTKRDDEVVVDMGIGVAEFLPDIYLEHVDAHAHVVRATLGNQHLVVALSPLRADAKQSGRRGVMPGLLRVRSQRQELGGFEISHDLVREVQEKISVDKNVNLGFIFGDRNQIYSHVYEAGVGFTNSCGSGACAAALALSLIGSVESSEPVIIRQPGGDLVITLRRERNSSSNAFHIVQQGPAREIFTGLCEASRCC